jgi:hypothetical protein
VVIIFMHMHFSRGFRCLWCVALLRIPHCSKPQVQLSPCGQDSACRTSIQCTDGRAREPETRLSIPPSISAARPWHRHTPLGQVLSGKSQWCAWLSSACGCRRSGPALPTSSELPRLPTLGCRASLRPWVLHCNGGLHPPRAGAAPSGVCRPGRWCLLSHGSG